MSLEEAIASACGRIAPVWPLRNFVAVNPFLGFTAQSFAATCTTMRRVARINMLMPRAFYRDALEQGTMDDGDLAAALAGAPRGWRLPPSVDQLRRAIDVEAPLGTGASAVVATVAEVLDQLASGDRQASRTAFMVDEISRWCAAYFDEGQSVWRLPTRGLSPYRAWLASMRHDLNAEMMGITGFRATIAALPEDPVGAIGAVVRAQGVPDRVVADYLHQALSDISGWAAYARYRVWNSTLYDRSDSTLVELLAIRISWGYTLFTQHTDARFRAAWQRAMRAAATPPRDEQLGEDADIAIDLVLQEAYEIAFQRRLLARFRPGRATRSLHRQTPRPALQAAFCIDVRSEVFRRALESQADAVQTLGFAGFFGYPIEYVKIGHTLGGAQCPVLMKPAYVVCEEVHGATPAEQAGILALRQLRRRVAKAWKSFKLQAVSSFIHVETAGILYAGKLLSDSLALTRPVKDPDEDGLDRAVIGRRGPRIVAGEAGGRQTGFDIEQRIRQAEAALRGMSLTGNFARLVLLVGHGSTTANNPHGSSLDCGACGGHTGEANARVAAQILNDPEVRAGLSARGIRIPADTWFLGCLHDTTTDAVEVFGGAGMPATHEVELDQVSRWLRRASQLTRMERAGRLGVSLDSRTEERMIARSRDWSQVRPEWGLAGNAAFIAAPRSYTRGMDLEGRVFLQEYDWQTDQDSAALRSIMTAPMVVASWINLQYFGSTVNNRAFGAGDKTLHNVTGTIGVLEGNAGDLKVGLPWQSVHDGARYIHEPLRLNVFLAAPPEAISAVIATQPSVRELVDNQWVHLFVIGERGIATHRYRSHCGWEPLDAG